MNLSVEPARRNGFFLKISTDEGTSTIHSRYAPSREAQRWADQLAEMSEKIILFGAGLGYLPRALEERQVKCFILEPLPKFSAPETCPIRELESKDYFVRFDPSLANDAIVSQIPVDFLAGAQPNIHPNYLSIFSSLEQVRDTVLTRGMGLLRGVESHYRFFHTWLENALSILPELPRMRSLVDLRDQLRGVPAILVGAGPSLDTSLNFLRRVSDDFFVLAVDTALYPLQTQGITPDLVVSVDPQKENLRYLEGIELRSGVTASLTAQPDFLRGAENSCAFPFYIASAETEYPMVPVFQEILKFVDGLSPLPAAGSVSTTGLALLKWFDCDPIINIGIDHAYTFHRAISRGTQWEQSQVRALNRFYTMAQAHLERIQRKGSDEQRDLQSIKSRRGETILTTDEYRDQNQWFQYEAQSYSGRCVDGRKDGAPMKYWEPMSREAISRFGMDRPLNIFNTNPLRSIEVDMERIQKWFEDAREELKQTSVGDIQSMVETTRIPDDHQGLMVRPLVRYLQTQPDGQEEKIKEYLKRTRAVLARFKKAPKK